MTTYASAPALPSPPALAFTRSYGGRPLLTSPPPQLVFTRGYGSHIGATSPAPLLLTFTRGYMAGASFAAAAAPRPTTGLLYPVRRHR